MIEIKNASESKDINEDERSRLEEELQKLTDKMMVEIEIIGKNKETELMRV